jgi:hypothetical protein
MILALAAGAAGVQSEVLSPGQIARAQGFEKLLGP